MYKKLLLLSLNCLILTSFVVAQENTNIDRFRLQQIHKLLDYRFTGGFYSFEMLFNKTVKYPVAAQQNCVVGIMVASFTVDCQGNMKNIKIRNALGFGLNKELTKFFQATKGHWNTCHNKRYTRFEIPIQFTLKGTKTDSLTAAIIFEGHNPGYACFSDDYYLKKAKEALKKRKERKAKEYLETLIHRNPYETKYYNMLKQAMHFNQKEKKKNKHHKK